MHDSLKTVIRVRPVSKDSVCERKVHEARIEFFGVMLREAFDAATRAALCGPGR
jgi:hypothetical protein